MSLSRLCPGLGGGVATSATASGAPAAEDAILLLDKGFGTANAAYSLRKLRAAYSGKCVKVRRASDDDEADVAFDDSNVVSGTSVITVTSGTYSGTMTLAAFTSGTNGFVVTWYDQSGSGYNGTQGTAASQPKLVNSGTILTDNGKPTLAFDGTNDFLGVGNELFGNTGLGTGPMSLWGVASIDFETLFGNRMTLIGEGTSSAGNYMTNYGDKIGMTFQNVTDYPMRWVRVSASGSASDSLTDTNFSTKLDDQMIVAYTWATSGTHRLATNGGTAATSTFTPNPWAGYANASIGAPSSNTASEVWKGNISEIVQWHSDQESNRSDIDDDVNGFYGTY